MNAIAKTIQVRPVACRSCRTSRPLLSRGLSRSYHVTRAFKEDGSTDVKEVAPEPSKNKIDFSVTGTDRSAYEAPLFFPVFSRRREVFAGRLAMIGFPVSLIAEALIPNHPGPLGQVAQFTGLPMAAVNILLAAVLIHGLLGLIPGGPTFFQSNQQDVMKRPAGPPFSWINPVKQPTETLGVSRWGFTKKNELFNSRLVMIGFLMACVNEYTTGGLGALGQVGKALGATLSDSYYNSTCLTVIAAWTVITGGLALLSGNWGQMEGDDEIY